MSSKSTALLGLCLLGLVPDGAIAGHERSKASGPGDELFNPPRVIQLDLEISAGQLGAMQKGSHHYGRGTVREGGASYANAGIRYKGNPDKEAASGKPDFTVAFNKFKSPQKFHGLKRVILLAGRDDPSYLSAPVGLELFGMAGIPAGRAGFAQVQLNGRDLGLYVLVEGVDPAVIRRRFATGGGHLYDEGDHTDVDGKLEKYGGKNSNDQADVDALAAAARQADPVQRWQQVQRLLDVDRFATFAALEVFLWTRDRYSIEASKFRIYHDPETDRMVFFPKNVEVVLEKTDGPLTPEWKGVVARGLLTTPEGERKYRAAMAKLLDTVMRPDQVRARARALAAIIRPAATGGNAEAGAKFDAAVN